MKRWIARLLAALALAMALAPSAMSDAEPAGSVPEEKAPEEPSGQPMPEDGMLSGEGAEQPPERYDAVRTIDGALTIEGETIESTGADENAVLITGGTAQLKDVQIIRSVQESAGGVSLFGVGAAVLATGGETTVTGGTIGTDAAGGSGVFAYGDGAIAISGTQITTRQDASAGILTAGGGTIQAGDLVVETYGASSAAIRSVAGGGRITVDGGTYVTHGSGSPAVDAAADIALRDAALAATDAGALCLDGTGSVTLVDCDLVGNMPDPEDGDTAWTVLLCLRAPGGGEAGGSRFEMLGGSLTSTNGGLFCTTNTRSEFVLSGVTLAPDAQCEYLLRCTGNARGWGAEGENECTFTGIAQALTGRVLWDSLSTLDFYVTQGSVFTGEVRQDERCADEGGEGMCSVTVDESSAWVVTGDSFVTNLACAGALVDEAGHAVAVSSPEGETLREGESEYTVYAVRFSGTCDLSGAGALTVER